METNNIENETNITVSDAENIMNIPRPIVGMAKEYLSGDLIEPHHHVRSQLLYASTGVMTVTTYDGVWVVPPSRAVWVPAKTEHQIKASGKLSMRTLYIEPSHCIGTSKQCCVVSVSPLLKELILHAVKMPALYPLNSPEERIMIVILDQIQNLDVKPLNLPIPKDIRLKEIFNQLSKNPGDQRTLEEWGKKVGATRRTLTRLFNSELGMSFGKWRQQIRILESLRRLAMNDPVTTIAIDLGYDSPSAFISMFKKALGKTPGQYFSA
ncbi:MAG: helix-turn-helix transcriptional regulator [Desulfobacterales bacterium]|nr:helix-turn-helix transcriptional regulator [Desulfobacterales bacterium]